MTQKQNEKFSNMTYAELMKFSQEHEAEWENGIPDWSDDFYKAIERTAEKEFPFMTLAQLNEIWLSLDDSLYDSVGDTCLKAMLGQEPITTVIEKIDALGKMISKMQTTLEVLFKQRESELANITIGQLNRLKGGI